MVRQTLKIQFGEAHMDGEARTSKNPPCHKNNEKIGKSCQHQLFQNFEINQRLATI